MSEQFLRQPFFASVCFHPETKLAPPSLSLRDQYGIITDEIRIDPVLIP